MFTMASEVTFDATFEGVMRPSPMLSNGEKKKSWDELRRCFRDSKKILTTLVSSIPSTFSFRNIVNSAGETITRIYFLGVHNKGRENTLLYVNLPNSEEINSANFTPTVLDWKQLLDSFQSSSIMGQLSREEQLMRERKRIVISGITSYEIEEHIGKFVFPANNNLYVCQDSDPLQSSCVVPVSINSYCHGARMDPKLCPSNPDLVAFIHDSDIWVTHLGSGSERRLTFAHKGNGQLSTDPLTAGVPSFVVQEEFDRHTGYWWRPKSLPSTPDGTSTYQILFEEVDESEVEILNLLAPSTEDHGIDEYRYPRAGTANAKSSLKIVEFEVDNDGIILDTVIEKQMVKPLNCLIPWFEYLVRAGWTPESNFIHTQLLDRHQQKSALIVIPLDHFKPVSSEYDMPNGEASNLPPVQIIYRETSSIWINTHCILEFLPQLDETRLSFIWCSEKSGFKHLYYVTVELFTQATNIDVMDIEEYDDNLECPECQILQEVAVTSGSWEVVSVPVWVDFSRKLVYFTAVKDTPLETHLYYVSYESPQEPVRLTRLGFSHTVTMNNDCSFFVSVYSSVKQSPRATVNRVLHTDDGIKATSVGVLMEHTVCPEFIPPELFNYDATSGYKTYGLYYKPHNYEVGKKYPTVLYVYGGPQVQLVTNSFKALKFLRLHTLASQGYAVIVIDCRGSSHRGLQFESILKNKLGTVEIEEQVEGLLYINSVVDFIDISRVAIHGWSYGGYLSLMGLAQRPDIFKLAIAGAPVVSWSLYDTGYTERYMGLPEDNVQAYKNGCVLDYVESFPDEENRLLIVHGLIDENVHFHHSNYLIDTLIRYCKPYRLQVYPNERHGIRSHEASKHYKTMVLSFLQNNL